MSAVNGSGKIAWLDVFKQPKIAFPQPIKKILVINVNERSICYPAYRCLEFNKTFPSLLEPHYIYDMKGSQFDTSEYNKITRIKITFSIIGEMYNEKS